MTYALVNRDRTQILRVGPRPEWIVDGEPASDAVLAAGGFTCDEEGRAVRGEDGAYMLATHLPGWLRVVQQPVEGLDPLLNELTWCPEKDWIIKQDHVIQPCILTTHSLVAVKGRALQHVDHAAEAARHLVITPGSGQAMEYDETKLETRQWQADPAPDIEDYPMLRAEWRARRIEEPQITPEEVVAQSIAEIDLWTQVGAAIKEVRRSAKVAIELAETPARVRQIVDWVDASLASATSDGSFEALPQG